MRRLVLCIGGLALLILLAIAVLIWGYAEFTSPGPLARATALVIPKGAERGRHRPPPRGSGE